MSKDFKINFRGRKGHCLTVGNGCAGFEPNEDFLCKHMRMSDESPDECFCSNEELRWGEENKKENTTATALLPEKEEERKPHTVFTDSTGNLVFCNDGSVFVRMVGQPWHQLPSIPGTKADKEKGE